MNPTLRCSDPIVSAGAAVAQIGTLASPRITILDDLSVAEPIWRALEEQAVLTPYQRFDWCKALIDSGLETGAITVVLIGPSAQPFALLPLVADRKWGLRRGRLIGTMVSNTDALIFHPNAHCHFDGLALDALLPAIATAAGGLDFFSFRNMATHWAGHANPLLSVDAQPSPSRFYRAVIGPSLSPFIEHRLTNKLRTNLKRGSRRLEELLGPVRLETVADADGFGLIHRAFVEQRGARFAKMGVTNVFAEAKMMRFFSLACQRGFTQERPVLMAHALYAGAEIVATSFGAQAGSHYSQYINSTSTGPASKYSLMGILVGHLMDDLLARGVTTFDMGLGDFPYKTDWTQPETVFDALVPMTGRGKLALGAMRAGIFTKRTIKQNPRLWRWAQSARRALYHRSSQHAEGVNI